MFTRKPTHKEIAANELEESRQALLAALSQRDYYTAIVTYHENRVQRLTQYTTPEDTTPRFAKESITK